MRALTIIAYIILIIRVWHVYKIDVHRVFSESESEEYEIWSQFTMGYPASEAQPLVIPESKAPQGLSQCKRSALKELYRHIVDRKSLKIACLYKL